MVNAAVDEKAAGEGAVPPPGALEVLVLRHDRRGYRPVTGDRLADLAAVHDLGGAQERFFVAPVLAHHPHEGRRAVLAVLFEQRLPLDDGGRDGFLAEDVLAGAQAAQDGGGQRGDGQHDIDGLDVRPRQERVLAGDGLDGVGDAGGERLRGGSRAAVDRDDLEERAEVEQRRQVRVACERARAHQGDFNRRLGRFWYHRD